VPTDSYDLVGIGIGPFNLALAALADPIARVRALFLDEKPKFSWHPGMMVPGARLQVPFLADLVSLVDPTSRYSYLAGLRDQGRLFEFYFSEQFHVSRIEYEAYCADVAARLPSCRFGSRVTAVRPARLPEGRDGFAVTFRHEPAGQTVLTEQTEQTVLTANVVLGIGTEPSIPETLRGLAEEAPDLVFHNAQYCDRAESIQAADDITVLGSGQSGAEVLLDLLRSRRGPNRRLRWITSAAAIEPMEYSKLGLEHFTPDYMDLFHQLPEQRRDDLLAGQGRLYKAVSAETLADIRAELDARSFPHGPAETGVTVLPATRAVGGHRDGEHVVLDLRHGETGQRVTVRTEQLILATGYTQRMPHCLDPVGGLINRDSQQRPVVGRDFRVELAGSAAGLYLQNAELHSHGVGTPDLGLGAYRAATILNAVAHDSGLAVPCYRLPSRTAHTVFDPEVAAAADPGLTVEPVSALASAPVSALVSAPSSAPDPGSAAHTAADLSVAAELPTVAVPQPGGRAGLPGPTRPQPAASRTGNRT
jgi:lysine N6-hydroxylase